MIVLLGSNGYVGTTLSEFTLPARVNANCETRPTARQFSKGRWASRLHNPRQRPGTPI
jgi:hypothetical protein